MKERNIFIFISKEKHKISKEKNPAREPFRLTQNISKRRTLKKHGMQLIAFKASHPTYRTLLDDPKVRLYPQRQAECQLEQPHLQKLSTLELKCPRLTNGI